MASPPTPTPTFSRTAIVWSWTAWSASDVSASACSVLGSERMLGAFGVTVVPLLLRTGEAAQPDAVASMTKQSVFIKHYFLAK